MRRAALADPLCGSLCDLCASVVSVFVRIFTTESQRTTENRTEKSFAQIEPMAFSAAC